MTYEEFIDFAHAHYAEGGDIIIECWGEEEFEGFRQMFGEMTEEAALEMIRLYSC